MKHLLHTITTNLIVFLLILPFSLVAQSPNILLVITDDLGVDYSNGYHESNLLPNTPTIDSLRATGITFENVFSTPKCTPSRATIISGKYGIKTNVLGTPGNLSTDHTSIFKAIENETNGLYADAVIGKWHISQPTNSSHPTEHSVDYYTGLLTAMVDDYYAWARTENEITIIDSTYVTTALTNAAIEWTSAQTQPWFLWLAHVAPHSPFHVPPDSLYTIENTDNNRGKFIAAIEAIDAELNRLISSLSTEELENTIIIFLGDNGSPNGVLQDYPSGHGKSTLYQGGIRVPLIISGKRVNRIGEREDALIHITDIYATLLEVVGADLPGGIYNSLSFSHLLDPDSTDDTRDYNYSEIQEGGENKFTIRNKRYKLIESLDDGSQEFFDLVNDSLETIELIELGLSADEIIIKTDLETEAEQIRTAWSCRDYIKNGDEEEIDCGGTYCDPCSTNSINTTTHNDAIQIYPNPTTNEVYISSSASCSVRVIDGLGAIKMTIPTANKIHHLNLVDLPKGMYLIELTDGNNTRLRKVIKN